MVGKNTQKPIVFDFSKELVGLPYQLGYGAENGLDCFTLLVNYLSRFGIKISESETIDGITLKNYREKYLDDHKVISTAAKFLSKILKEKNANRIFVGDILMIEYNGKKFFGIDAGNGNILTVNLKTGVKIVHGDIYRILKVWAIR